MGAQGVLGSLFICEFETEEWEFQVKEEEKQAAPNRQLPTIEINQDDYNKDESRGGAGWVLFSPTGANVFIWDSCVWSGCLFEVDA